MTRDCLESVYCNAGALSCEVIVVDNNSQDGSLNMIAGEFPDVILIANHANLGFAAANNQGLAVAKGECQLLLNSDTIIIGDVLEKSVVFLKMNHQVGAMGCQVLNTDGSIQPTCSGFPTLFRLTEMTLALDRIPGLSFLDTYLMRHWKRDSEREVEVVSGCYLMFRKTVLEQVGGLDERFFFFAEETDWCRRAREAGLKLYFSPVGQIVHHGGGSVKKLSYKRDVMLTAATVRLHRKYGGIPAALMVYFVLMLFNVSRLLMWGLYSLKSKNFSCKAKHFRNVVKSHRACWPD
ncbi:MAG: glycosyltransferase family 2 protein [Chlorobium sp.]|nr:glycosyltransferase family 2 protein [Chlorobium sp.]